MRDRILVRRARQSSSPSLTLLCHSFTQMCPSQDKFQQNVWEANKDDSVISTVDAFFGALPACGLLPWIPFGKSIIAIEGTHWINGAHVQCDTAFVELKKQSRNLFGANNIAGQHLSKNIAPNPWYVTPPPLPPSFARACPPAPHVLHACSRNIRTNVVQHPFPHIIVLCGPFSSAPSHELKSCWRSLLTSVCSLRCSLAQPLQEKSFSTVCQCLFRPDRDRPDGRRVRFLANRRVRARKGGEAAKKYCEHSPRPEAPSGAVADARSEPAETQ